jgi:hypothetical protein
MKLRFEVDRYTTAHHVHRYGRSVETIEIESSRLSAEEKELLGDRLVGIDVVLLRCSERGVERLSSLVAPDLSAPPQMARPVRIVATAPTLDALMTAVRENDRQVTEQQRRHRALAIATADAGVDTVSAMEELVADPSVTETQIQAFVRRHRLDPSQVSKTA